MNKIEIATAIRDLLDMNDINSNPVSMILNVEIQFEGDDPIVRIECRHNENFEIRVNSVE